MKRSRKNSQAITKRIIILNKQKPLVQERRHGYGDFFYILMRKSLIPGFPVMAVTKSTLRRIVKLLAILICTAGFICQTLNVLDVYPTVVKSEVTEKGSIIAPAVTICNKNRLHRRPYCAAFPHHCETLAKSKEEFCELLPKYCPIKSDPSETFQTVLQDYADSTNRSNEVLNMFGLKNYNDLIARCVITKKAYEHICNNFVMIQASRNGYPYKCVTVESLWGRPEKIPRDVPQHEEYVITVSIHPEEYFNHHDRTQAYVYIHDSRALANPMSKGIALDAGNSYRLYVTMERRESLPAPFSTNCTDYERLWLDNGGNGPLSKEDCIQVCKINSMVKNFGCVSQSVTYPNSYPICEDVDIRHSDEVITNCLQDCKETCAMNIYTFKYETHASMADILKCHTCLICPFR